VAPDFSVARALPLAIPVIAAVRKFVSPMKSATKRSAGLS